MRTHTHTHTHLSIHTHAYIHSSHLAPKEKDTPPNTVRRFRNTNGVVGKGLFYDSTQLVYLSYLTCNANLFPSYTTSSHPWVTSDAWEPHPSHYPCNHHYYPHTITITLQTPLSNTIIQYVLISLFFISLWFNLGCHLADVVKDQLYKKELYYW